MSILTRLLETPAPVAIERPPAEPPEDADTRTWAQPESEPKTWADIGATLGPIRWAWPRWLADGFLALVASRSGLGKSSLALRIAACYLRGDAWPDGAPFEGARRQVLWCESEGAQALNLARCCRWGLNPRDVLTPLPDLLGDVDLTNPTHRDAIARAAQRDEVGLVVLDSLSAAVAGKRDENAAGEMLQVTAWLSHLARNTGKPVLATHHLRKKGLMDGDAVSLDRLRGSTSIVQVARLVWALDTPNPAAPDALRLSVIKSNLDRFPEPLGLAIGEGGLDFAAAPSAERQPNEGERAEMWLRNLLAGGPVEAADVVAQAQQEDIAEKTLRRAKEAMWIQSRREGGSWVWALPDLDDNA